ncbi:hypothetical protein Q4566_10165 [Tamlana sp. 2_MG-2023]|uniref:hypothetical protein n=1 Tax=unclassified Tamlana TaxID=2614803 RepID=UPI0026E35950|nr:MULTISPECIES: hypothetical protein [unclassified Tamlana]MDO6760563.1 hypothetical protein [Tamlana sp. 2_MG-2023]MDO6790819.1 hypothetical protein [Tamlana sp. 1_MG-2023]
MIKTKFNNELQILEITFTGEIHASDVCHFISSFKKNKSYPKKLKGIITATETVFKFSIPDLSTFDRAKSASLENCDLVVMAIIINNASTAAMSTLFQIQANNKDFKFNVFSTREAAKFWLDSYTI